LAEEQDATSVTQILDRAPQLLTFGEEIEYIATANKNVAGLVPDCVVATDRRLIDYRRKMLGKTEVAECYWRDIRHMDIKEGRNGVTLRVASAEGWRFMVDSLPRAQALRLYEVGAQHSLRLQIKLQETLAAAAAYAETRQQVQQAAQPPVITQAPSVTQPPPVGSGQEQTPTGMQTLQATQTIVDTRSIQVRQVSEPVLSAPPIQAPQVIEAPQTFEMPQAAQTPLAPQVSQAPQMPVAPQAAQAHEAIEMSRATQPPQATQALDAMQTPQAVRVAVIPPMPSLDQEPAPVEKLPAREEEQFGQDDAEPDLEAELPEMPQLIKPVIPPDMDLLLPPFPPEPPLVAQSDDQSAMHLSEQWDELADGQELGSGQNHDEDLHTAYSPPPTILPEDEQPPALPTVDELPLLPTPVDEQPEDDPSTSRGMDDLDDLFFALLRKGKADSKHPGELMLGEPYPKTQRDLPFSTKPPAGPSVTRPTVPGYPNGNQDLPEQMSPTSDSNAANDTGTSHILNVDHIPALGFPETDPAEVTWMNEPHQPTTPNAHDPNAAEASQDRTAHTAGLRQVHSSGESPLTKLRQLKRMLDEGLINQADYEAKKADILSRI
jgi:hypothetical protein